jgi:hypothetical protein
MIMDKMLVALFDLCAERIAGLPQGDQLLGVVALLTAIGEKGVDLATFEDCLNEAMSINFDDCQGAASAPAI